MNNYIIKKDLPLITPVKKKTSWKVFGIISLDYLVNKNIAVVTLATEHSRKKETNVRLEIIMPKWYFQLSQRSTVRIKACFMSFQSD